MNLYLMRHADAEEGAGDDFSRRLSDAGVEHAKAMANWLKRLGVVPDLAVSSPYPRAEATARIVAERLGGRPPETDPRLAPGMRPDVACALIHESARADGDLMLVGHAPDLDRLAAHLIGAGAESVVMRKGAVACLHCRREGHAGSQLQWLINPALLESDF